MIDAALRYAANGWSVLPLWTVSDGTCTCPRGDECRSSGKHPRTDLAPNGVKDATTDQATIASWPDDINVGVALGQVSGGVMAFDVDHREIAAQLLDASLGIDRQTGIAITGRLGCHIFFVCSGATHTFHLKDDQGARLGEVRGDGAYVVLPPSQAPERLYQWVEASRTDDIPKLERTRDAFRYVENLLSLVGVTLEPDQDKVLPANIEPPMDPIIEQDLPEEIERDAKLFETRQAFRGGISRQPTRDRSGKLYHLALSMMEAAGAASYPITAEQIAGVIKKADQILFDVPKYAHQANADTYYWMLALKVLPDRVLDISPTSMTKVAINANSANDYVWDEQDGWLYWQAGKTVRKVCNFKPELLEDIEVDYGDDSDDEKRRAWRVSFTQAAQTIEFIFDAEDKESASAVEKAVSHNCPASFMVEPSMYGRLKTAIVAMSSHIIQRRVFGATGWWQHGGDWLYLLPNAQGAIGPNGLVPAVKIDKERLPNDSTVTRETFAGYGRGVRPPLNHQEQAQAWTALEALVNAGDPAITYPVVLMVLGGPLSSAGAGESPPLLHMMGKTGTLKTSYCLAALSLMGTFGATSAAPAAFSSTANFLQIVLHAAKDLTLLIDDYKQSVIGPSKRDIVRVIQNYADRTTRGRARRNQEIDIGKTPRGLLMTNGEDRWESEASAEARTIVLSLKPDDINKGRLKTIQDIIEAGHLQRAGGSYLVWLAQHPLIVEGQRFRQIKTEWHQKLLKSGQGQTVHLRILVSLSTMLAVGSVVSEFIGDVYGAQARETANGWLKAAGTYLTGRVEDMAQEVAQSSPFSQFLEAIRGGMSAQRATLLPVDGVSETRQRLPSRPGAEPVGYYFTDTNDAPLSLLLTRNVSFGWYEKEMRSRGLQTDFSWSAIMQEAGNEHDAVRIDKVRVKVGEDKVSQISGIGLPLHYLAEEMEGQV